MLPSGPGSLFVHTNHLGAAIFLHLCSYLILYQLTLHLFMGFVKARFGKTTQFCLPHRHSAHQNIVPQSCLRSVDSFLGLPFPSSLHEDSCGCNFSVRGVSVHHILSGSSNFKLLHQAADGELQFGGMPIPHAPTTSRETD